MGDGISRRNLIKSLGAISMATALGSAGRLFSAAPAFTGAPSQKELILNFRGLWAFVVRDHGIAAVTARIGEHSYHIDQRPLESGQYTLTGVRHDGVRPDLKSKLVIYTANPPDMDASYLYMDLPFPKQVKGSQCLVKAQFSGDARRTHPPQFPIAHAFHYDVDSTTKIQLKPLQDWPGLGKNSKLDVQIAAEPPCPLGNPNHPKDAFQQLIKLFPNVNLILDSAKCTRGCPHPPKKFRCSEILPGTGLTPDAQVDNLSNPDNCIQAWVRQPG